MYFSYLYSVSTLKHKKDKSGVRHLEEACPGTHTHRHPKPLHGSYLRISQEKVGPDLIDVGQCGSPTDPQQSLQ